MTLSRSILSTLVLSILIAGCSGSKSFAKKAGKLDDAGLYAEAADMYLQSVQRSKKNVDAKIGLKKTGQLLLNDKLSAFFKANSMGDAKANAVSSYLDAKAYQERVERLGVILDIPDHYRTDFESVKGAYLVQLYSEGQALLEKQDFPAAERKFNEIAKLEPNYKDASSLQSVAYLEPLYRTAKQDMEGERFRQAYAGLSKIIAKDAAYKDASTLRQECVAKGQFPLAVAAFTQAGKTSATSQKAQAYAITSLTETNDPFLKIVDRENLERILEEQRLSLSGVVDEQTAVRVGNLIGAKAVLMGEVVDYREEPGSVRRSTKDGYESYKMQQVNKETGEKYFVTKYKPVRYTEYFQENKVFVSFAYRLVSLETGEVLMSKMIERRANDNAHYASYDGKREDLMPSHNGQVDTRSAARSQLNSLFTASHELKSVGTLSNDAIRAASSEIASSVQQDLNNKIP